MPSVNENDSVAIEELKFGDNDRLSALVAGLVSADLLLILSDVDGLLSVDPRVGDGSLVQVVTNIDAAIAGVSDEAGKLGTGGMASKLRAARSAARRGIPTIIANGRRERTLSKALDASSSVGTLIQANLSPLSSRKHWIAYGMACRGRLIIDDGAVTALQRRGGSLLPSGICEVQGSFDVGDCVSCTNLAGKEIARGLVNYDAAACKQIRGAHSNRIGELLGYDMGDEIIHRDNLILLSEVGENNGEPAP